MTLVEKIVDLTEAHDVRRRLRDRARSLIAARAAVEVAELELSQAVHDAWSSGTSAGAIAEATGLASAQVEAIAVAWPSLPAVVAEGPS
jgi:Tfp pilus assembly protein PilX